MLACFFRPRRRRRPQAEEEEEEEIAVMRRIRYPPAAAAAATESAGSPEVQQLPPPPQHQRRAASSSQGALVWVQCPVCPHMVQRRDDFTAMIALRFHLRSHPQVHRAIFADSDSGLYGCPACSMQFGRMKMAINHLAQARDPAHARLRLTSRVATHDRQREAAAEAATFRPTRQEGHANVASGSDARQRDSQAAHELRYRWAEPGGPHQHHHHHQHNPVARARENLYGNRTRRSSSAPSSSSLPAIQSHGERPHSSAEPPLERVACPICEKVFRPRGMCALEALKAHLIVHPVVKYGIFRRSSSSSLGCPACPCRFSSFREVIEHLFISTDADHEALKRSQGESRTSPRAQSSTRPDHGNEEDTSSLPSIYVAAKAGDESLVKCLLESNIDPNAGAEDGYSPLMAAAETGHTGVVRLLLSDPRCDANAKNVYGQTALAMAAQNNHYAVVHAIVDGPHSQVNLDVLCGEYTAAERARMAGHHEVADFLAGVAQEKQIAKMIAVLEDGGAAGGRFDSMSSRIEALCKSLDVRLPLKACQHLDYGDDNDGMESTDFKHECILCMEAEADTALQPCFHASFCSGCAHMLDISGEDCPVCRQPVEGVQRIYM